MPAVDLLVHYFSVLSAPEMLPKNLTFPCPGTASGVHTSATDRVPLRIKSLEGAQDLGFRVFGSNQRAGVSARRSWLAVAKYDSHLSTLIISTLPPPNSVNPQVVRKCLGAST